MLCKLCAGAVLEELHGPLTLLGRLPGAKRAQVPSLACAWIEFSRIKPVLS
jgi:hypothetical protein